MHIQVLGTFIELHVFIVLKSELATKSELANKINLQDLRAHARTIEFTKSDFLEKTLPGISV